MCHPLPLLPANQLLLCLCLTYLISDTHNLVEDQEPVIDKTEMVPM
jgi:hypothetical protein